jgi:uncharacterized protein
VAASLKAQLRDDITAALKAGEKVRLGALRMLSASVTNREKDVLHDLSDDEVREAARKEIKKRTEAIEAFDGAGRTELADKERAERDVLAAYAPPQLDEASIDALVDEAIARAGASTPQELGKVMGLVMARARGKVDGAAVQRKVRARLGG